MRLLPTIILTLLVSVPSYAQQKITKAEAKTEIYQLAKTFDEAWNKGDIERLGSLFTNDAIFITPGGIVRGREATEKNLALRAGKSIHYNTVDQVHLIDDNSFWAVGSWKFVGNNGGPTFSGYWGDYGVRQGNSWRFKLVTINVTPPKGQEAKNPPMK
jgi:ketosteroid isomerase-like protein